MSAEVLREAAALMRQRADNSAEATVGPLTWTSSFGSKDSQTCVHYQSWRPAVALAVADWLDAIVDDGDAELADGIRALVVARAYLGDPS